MILRECTTIYVMRNKSESLLFPEFLESKTVRIDSLDKSVFDVLFAGGHWGWLLQRKPFLIHDRSKICETDYRFPYESYGAIILRDGGEIYIYPGDEGEGHLNDDSAQLLYEEGVRLLKDHGVTIPSPKTEYFSVHEYLRQSEVVTNLELIEPGTLIAVPYDDVMDLVGTLSRNAIQIGKVSQVLKMTAPNGYLWYDIHFQPSHQFVLLYEQFVPGEEEKIVGIIKEEEVAAYKSFSPRASQYFDPRVKRVDKEVLGILEMLVHRPQSKRSVEP